MLNEEVSNHKTQIIQDKNLVHLKESKQLEHQEKILRLFKILHQINLKKKIVKIPTYEEVKNIGNTNNGDKAV